MFVVTKFKKTLMRLEAIEMMNAETGEIMVRRFGKWVKK